MLKWHALGHKDKQPVICILSPPLLLRSFFFFRFPFFSIPEFSPPTGNHVLYLVKYRIYSICLFLQATTYPLKNPSHRLPEFSAAFFEPPPPSDAALLPSLAASFLVSSAELNTKVVSSYAIIGSHCHNKLSLLGTELMKNSDTQKIDWKSYKHTEKRTDKKNKKAI